jgi:hypothetical protein
MQKIIRLPYPIPYYAQIASPELAEAIFVQGMDPALDPRWVESGARTAQEYAYWVERACGVACLKMCVEALGGPILSLIEWARLGLERGGYLIRTDENGDAHEVGWIHSALADMARENGLKSAARPASLDEIISCLEDGQLVVASISYQAGDDRLEITKKGGHLMVVHGAEYDVSGPLAFIVNNPSGRRADLQEGARLAAQRFEAAYSGRIITFQK